MIDSNEHSPREEKKKKRGRRRKIRVWEEEISFMVKDHIALKTSFI